uniref:Uncharacterized protein n=1 Tax=Glossina palpalis gambiensis TaxID=67801 RepID=A0A1B0BID4_9MUSC
MLADLLQKYTYQLLVIYLNSYNVISEAQTKVILATVTKLAQLLKLRKLNKMKTAFAKHAIVHIKKLDKDDVIHLDNAQT